jgi:hypothetical protein
VCLDRAHNRRIDDGFCRTQASAIWAIATPRGWSGCPTDERTTVPKDTPTADSLKLLASWAATGEETGDLATHADRDS